jgi:hypothetical protein
MTAGGLALTALGGALALTAGVAATLALDVRGRAAAALATLVLAAASVILPAEALSLVDRLEAGPWLAGQALLAAAALATAVRLGRRLPRVDARAARAALARGARAHPAVAVLAGAAALGMASQAVMAVLVMPGNWDAMGYHLSKAAYWLQYDSATQFPDGTWRQLYTPPNAELLQAWTMELLGTDRIVQLVQWTAGVACGLAVHLGARELGEPPARAVFAAALFVALPQPLLQSASAQNDLVVAAFVAAAGLFVVRGLRTGHRGELVVGGAAAGLAVGTKGSAFIAGAGLAVVVAGVLIACRPSRRTVATGLAAITAGIVLLGAFNWVLTIRNTGRPAPSVAADVTRSVGEARPGRSALDGIVGNAGHTLWQFADLPGVQVTVLDRVLAKPVRATFGERWPRRDLPLRVDTLVNEDKTGYGAVGFFLLLPVLLVAAFGRRTAPARRLLAGGSLVTLAIYLVFIASNPFVMRSVLPWVAITAPLPAVLARRPALRVVTVCLALVSLVPVVVAQDARPLIPAEGRSILAMSRSEQLENQRWPLGTAVSRLEEELGPTAPIGFSGSAMVQDYPFFGPRRERFVRRLPDDQATPERARRDRLAGVVFFEREPPAGFRRVWLGERVWLGLPR